MKTNKSFFKKIATLLAITILLPATAVHIAKAYNFDYSNSVMYFSGRVISGWSSPGITALNPIYLGDEFPDGTTEPGAFDSSGNVMPNKAGAYAQPNDPSNTGGAGGAVGFTALGLTGAEMRNDPDRKQKLFDFLRTKNQTGTDWEKMGSAQVVHKMIRTTPVDGPWTQAHRTITPAQWTELENRLVNNPSITMTYNAAEPVLNRSNTNGVTYTADGDSVANFQMDVVDSMLSQSDPSDSPVQAAWVFRDTSEGNDVVLTLEVNCANLIGNFDGLPPFTPAAEEVDLELTKLVDGVDADTVFTKSERIEPGTPFSYRVTVENTSDVQATGVVVRDPLPAGVTLLSATTSQGSVTPSSGLAPTIDWSVGTIDPDEEHTMTLSVVVYPANFSAYSSAMASGVSRNVAQVYAANEDDVDSIPGNVDTPYVPGSREDDEDHADTFVETDLELTKLVDGVDADSTFTKSERIEPDVPFQYRITVENTSQVPATGVVVRDPLPAGVTLLGTTASQGGVTPSSGLAPTLNWTIGNVAVGATQTLIIDAVVYNADLPAYRAALSSGISRNVAQIYDMNEDDIDSTPGNVDVPYVPGGREDDEDHADTFMLAGLGDYVWFDENSNGQQDATEEGINDVEVCLMDGTGSIIEVTTTHTNGSQDGYYEFTELNPGEEYTVCFVAPDGYEPTIPNAVGVDDTADSDADAITGETAPVTLAPGEFNPTIDAGYTPLLSLGDTVWFDENDNGLIDGGESGIPNIPVILYEDSNNDGAIDPDEDTVVDTTVTDDEGKYLFDELPRGDYFVVIPSTVIDEGEALEQCRPSSVVFGNPNTDIDSDNNGALRGELITSESPITLLYGAEPQNSGAANLTYDFGFHCPVPEVPNTGVATTVNFLGPIAALLSGLALTGIVTRYITLKR